MKADLGLNKENNYILVLQKQRELLTYDVLTDEGATMLNKVLHTTIVKGYIRNFHICNFLLKCK